MAQSSALYNNLEEAMLPPAPGPRPRPHVGRGAGSGRDEAEPRRLPDEAVRPPSSQADDLIETRSSRSASTASRSTNRLSLTLPIAPPTAYPSRPMPMSATTASFPPTPVETSSLTSPADTNDFITAIASQERRVMELKEELERAEKHLAKLKKQWATHEVYKKRGERRKTEVMRPLGPPMTTAEDDTPVRRSEETDRRKALLLGLAGQQANAAPESGRRRTVFTGGHTRTLSLLSPTKPTGPFSAQEDGAGSGKTEDDSQPAGRYASAAPAQLYKRASWAPRSTQQTGGVKQIAQDFKSGLLTFMEDLRQATVGDEPITGQGHNMRSQEGSMRSAPGEHASSQFGDGDQDTIRASGANSRPRAAAAFDLKQDGDDDLVSRPIRPLQRSKTESAKSTTAKRFSWTPLTADTWDDEWSNWDSPSVSSPRWSGTTINGDIIPAAPEKRQEEDTPLRRKSSKSGLPTRSTPPTPNKFEELLPPMLNALSPSNLKRTAADLMKEWEKSLSPPSPTPVERIV